MRHTDVTSNDYLALPTQTQLVLRISQLIGFSSSFIFLSGTTGSGRTAICEQLMNRLDVNQFVCYSALNSDMNISQVREDLVLQLLPNAVFDANDPLRETLIRLKLNLSRPTLLVIDNADSLAADWVLELWQWLTYIDEVNPSHKISVLLIGSSEFSEYLAQHLKGRAQMALEIEIEPLTLKEQKELLLHYLKRRNISSTQEKDAQARLIHCNGKPEDVVAIAEACMDKKSLSSFGKIALPANKIVAAVAILAGVVLLLSWIIPSSLNKKAVSTPEAVAQPERQAVALPPSTSAAVTQNGVVPTSSALPTAVTQDGIVPSATGVDAEQAEDETNKQRVVINDQALQQITATQSAVETKQTDHNDQGSAVVTSAHQLEPIVNEIKEKKEPLLRSESVHPPIVPVKKATLPKVKKQPEHPVEHKVSKISNKPVAVTKAVVKTKPSPSVGPVTKSGYALQLASSGDAAALKKLAASNGLQSKTQIYKNQTSGKYVLIYGEYTSTAAAKAAVTGLPAAVKNAKPWPKPYAQIRTEQGK
jgi:DamX protein